MGNFYYLFSVPLSMFVKGYKVSINIYFFASAPNLTREIPDHIRTHKMCVKEVHIEP